MRTDLAAFCTPRTVSLRQAVAQMDASRLGIILVVDAQGGLEGVITDGDIRRAVLDRVDFTQPVTALLARKAGTAYAQPLCARDTDDPARWQALIAEHNILHLPLVDAQRRVTGLVTMEEFLASRSLAVQAVVMAGGFGRRLDPITRDIPKPMLPVGDRPLLEIIIGQLRDAGIRTVQVAAHHKADTIAKHFGDGRNFGVELSYIEEAQPLGTGGGLGLLEVPPHTTLVMNGDILTQMDFRAMLAYHREHQADLTVAVRHYEMTVPYGVVECEGSSVRRLSEKPLVSFFVNAGIYLLEPSVYGFMPRGQRFDMTDLIQRLLEARRPVVSFPIREYWRDIGQHEDYQQAQAQAKQWASP
jgi:dTDP-glucose pyrophosphorylase